MRDLDREELHLLRTTARQVLTGPHDLRKLGELGFLGLLTPEDAGGAGRRIAEACLIAVEAGRALSPVPWAGTALAAACLAASPAHTDVVARLLRGEAAGLIGPAADRTAGTVSGAFTVVGGGPVGAVVLLDDDGRPALAVDPAGPGVRIEPAEDPLDTTRETVTVTLTGATATEVPGVARAHGLLAAADSLGAIQANVESLVAYLAGREAFGRKIAAFQAVQHRLADLTVLAAAGTALVERAAAALAANGPDAGRLVAAAETYLARHATAALDDCIQLAGGLGFTWEWPFHHAMRRAARNAAGARAAAGPLLTQRTRPAPDAFRSRIRSVIAGHAPFTTRDGHRAPTSPAQEAALRRWYRALYDEGLVGASWPAEWGGRPGHESWHDLVVVEELIRARAPRPIDQVLLASHVLLTFGSRSQQARYLPRIRSGADIWCQLFSEPGAGSDLAGITARATRRDDGTWLLAGQKTWTTDGHWAQLGLALLRTDHTATRHNGITAFAIPMDTPGLVVQPKRTIGGAEEFNDVFLDGVELGPDQVIGEVGQGWAVAMSGLEVERFTVGGNVAQLELLLDDLLSLAGAVAVPDGTNAAIAGFAAESEAARAYATGHLDRVLAGVADEADAPIAKLLYTESYNRLARFGAELAERHTPVPGAAGEAAQRLRDAWLWSRALTISGGSSEIMRDIVARRRLGLPSSRATAQRPDA